MPRRLSRPTALALLVALAMPVLACATKYQARGATGGYSETQLAEDVFLVSFNGNGYTSAERAADFALLRSAEIAAAYGYPYFVVVDAKNTALRYTRTTPTTTTGSATVIGNTVYGTATTSGGHTYVVAKPTSRNTIVVLKTKPTDTLAFESAFIIRSIRSKYNLDSRR